MKKLAQSMLDETLDANLLVGGKYLLEEEVGRGGMGSVWRGVQVDLKRYVALKFLGAPSIMHAHERFVREAQALAKLSHPGITQVFDFGVEDAQPFLVMEWLEGTSLAHVIETRAPLAANQVASWGVELCEALAHAHERGVLHRDVKPSNVMLVQGKRLVLVDFGIARAIPGQGDLPVLTESALVAGTPGFVAPELFTGASPEVRHDIYALGGTLLALSALIPDGDNAKAELVRALKRAIAVEPEERPESVRAFAETLLPTAAPVRPSLKSSRHVSEGEHSWISAVAMVFTLTSGLGLWALVQCLTPRVVTPGELSPLTHWVTETLTNGQLVSRARFEVMPTLVFVLGGALSFAAFGALRTYWSKFQPPVDLSLARLHTLLGLSLAIIVTFAMRHILGYVTQGSVYAAYVQVVPLLGGLMELAALFLFYECVLIAMRVSAAKRPPLWRLELGGAMIIALLPPTWTFFSYLVRWHYP